MAHPYWPLFDLRVRTPTLELRPPTDDDLVPLARLAAAGIHEPGAMPFLTPWTDLPSPEMERGVLQFTWRQRAELAPESWHLPLMVVCEGTVVGVQGIESKHFAVRRAVETGSWLGRAHQGQGIGKEMRAAVLHFAFAGLGAEVAFSGAFVDNPASIGVSRALGYEDDGQEVHDRRGRPARQLRFRMERDAWEARRRADITIEGLEPCLPFLVGDAG